MKTCPLTVAVWPTTSVNRPDVALSHATLSEWLPSPKQRSEMLHSVSPPAQSQLRTLQGVQTHGEIVFIFQYFSSKTSSALRGAPLESITSPTQKTTGRCARQKFIRSAVVAALIPSPGLKEAWKTSAAEDRKKGRSIACEKAAALAQKRAPHAPDRGSEGNGAHLSLLATKVHTAHAQLANQPSHSETRQALSLQKLVAPTSLKTNKGLSHSAHAALWKP